MNDPRESEHRGEEEPKAEEGGEGETEEGGEGGGEMEEGREMDEEGEMERAREHLEARHVRVLYAFPPPTLTDQDLHEVHRKIVCILSELSSHRKGRKAGMPEYTPKASAPALIDALLLARTLRSDLDRMEAELIEEARAHGVIWRKLARALGVGGRAAAENRASRLRARVNG